MRERRTHGSVRGLRREPLVYSTGWKLRRRYCEKSDFIYSIGSRNLEPADQGSAVG